MASEPEDQRSPQTFSFRTTHRRAIPARSLQHNPLAPAVSQWPVLPPSSSGTGSSPPPPLVPQIVGSSFLGAQISDTVGYIPPDSMGTVGPSQVLVIVNGRIKVFSKTGTLGPLNADTDTFFSSVSTAGTSDPHVRYDRLSQRWFITMIDVASDNKILIAVSSGPTITGSSSFTFFQFQHDLVGTTPNSDTGGFADYDTLGVDKFALYIGVNVYNSSGTAVIGTTGFVVNKANLLAGTLTVTPFRQIGAISGTGAGPWTPQGVDNDDPNATEGYFIAVDNASFGKLVLRRISNPGGSPSISANLNLTVPSTDFPISQPNKGSSKNLDALDDRLFGAAIRKNKITGTTSLYTAHNIQVNSSGVASTSGGRNGSRWYEIGNLTGTPALLQSGTLFDSATTSPRGFWIPSVAVSGQGHMALGCSYASVNDFAGVATAGRLRSDPLGSIQSATLAVVSSTAYNITESGTSHRWGDFSQVAVDPADEMTMWTFQEYCNAANSWGVRAVQLKAPPPATPASASPASLAQGQSSVNVVITGPSLSGSEFFDPGLDTGGPGFSNHLAVAVNGGGITVNSVTFSNPTNITVNLTVAGGAAVGARTITVTNPDGQSATSASGILTIIPSGPFANFVAAPTNGFVPLLVSFTNLSTGATNYSWDFGDGNTSILASPANTYASTGTYTVTLIASAGTETNTLVRTNYISVTTPPPLTADFAASATSGAAPLTVSFTNLSTSATNYAWDFGDGHTSAAVNPSNIYSDAGSYTVMLAAVGSEGTNILVRTNYIVVTNAPPLIVAQPQNQTVSAGASATFNVTATGTPPLAFQWRFNGTNIAAATDSTYVRSNVQLADSGAYSVVVSNGFGPAAVSSNAILALILDAIPVTGSPYTQDFNSMGPSGTTTPPGWYVGTGTAAISGTNVTPGTGSANVGGNYNFGSSGSSDRALGSLASASTQRDTEARFINVSGALITSFTINYSGEEWRVGGNGSANNDLVLQYSTDGISFTPMGAQFNFNTPVDSGTAAALDGNAAANRLTGIGGTYTPAASLTNGQRFYLRWADVDNPSADNAMAVDDFIISFTLTNPPPPALVADFTAAPTSGLAPLIVSFSNLSSGATSYAWDFGDGNTSTAASPANTYTNPGSYTVSLTAIGPGSTNILTRPNYVLVTNPLPVIAGFTANPTSGVAPLFVSFSNLSTDASSYSWDFGDGNTSTASNPANTYSNAGNYAVSLTATGAGGTNSLVRTNYIVVTNPPPSVIVDFTANSTSGVAPLSVSFTNLSSGATDYSWNFGDGNTGTAANPINTYTNPGSYTVSLTAIGGGITNILTRTNYVIVSNQPPLVAAFTANPTSGVAPLTVFFTNLSSGASDYIWDFGDGNFSGAVNPTNTYTNAGSYTISLAAIGAGSTNILTQTNYILILNPGLLMVTPDSIDFGTIFTNTTAQSSFVISNAGGAALSGTATLSVNPFFLIDPLAGSVSNYSFSLPALSSTNITIAFTPLDVGQFSNLVVFASDGGSSTNLVQGQGASAPVILSSIVSGTDLQLTFQTVSGPLYLIQYKDPLEDLVWHPLQSVNGDGTFKTNTLPLSASSQRFFRLLVQ